MAADKPIIRDEKGRLVAGTGTLSPLGAGANPVTQKVKALLRGDTEAARLRLVELMASDNDKVAVQAVAIVLSYGLGAPGKTEDREELMSYLRGIFAWLENKLSSQDFQTLLDMVSPRGR